MKTILHLLRFAIFVTFPVTTFAQLPYTTPQFSYDSTIDVSYGSAVDYAGNNVDLLMDIYTPRNGYCNRPIAVLVHGGAWIAGSKEDADLVYLSRYLVQRGYVVANVNYRLGMHKASNYTMYLACNSTTLSNPCAYISDSAEVYRANFRAMQDVKGAIRYMKSRYLQDSTDYTNVFLVGESAGAFVSMTTAFLTDASEKPLNCGAIADAPSPDSDMYTYSCIPTPISLTRPDLGSVDGDLHLGTYDASVRGVGNFFGGLLQSDIVDVSETNDLALYTFHQGSDIIVHYNYGRLLGRLSYECYGAVNICQPYYFYPFAYGNKGLDLFFQGISAQFPFYQAEIIENYEYQNDCADNGHSIAARDLRAANMTDIFANQLDALGNQPSTVCSMGFSELMQTELGIYPNPSAGTIYWKCVEGSGNWEICGLNGKVVRSGKMDAQEMQLNISDLLPGIYLLRINDTSGRTSFGRFVKQ